MFERRVDLFLAVGQREPCLHARNGRARRALGLRRALRMNDAAPRGPPFARAGADRRIGAEAVAMVDRAPEQIRQPRTVAMRVRAHFHPLPGLEMPRAALIDNATSEARRAGETGV